jgi:membrane protein DedA with SNARE-associated domain/rhodanese-related sulfurtransferase
MLGPTHTWWNFGYAGVFLFVFLEQLGVPIPAFPVLIAAGALVASGGLNMMACVGVALIAALLADNIWYGIGRAKGTSVLLLMCRLFWKPDACVNRTKILFVQYGSKTLLFAKFVSGLSTLAPPLAGITQIPFTRFILFDGLGAFIWAVPPLVVGSYLQKGLGSFEAQLSIQMPSLLVICGVVLLVILGWRYLHRRTYRNELGDALSDGIHPEELKQMIDEARDVFVLDIRDEVNVKANPVGIANASWIPYSALLERIKELPCDKPVIVYCDCPQAQAAVSAAKVLKDHGVAFARPLLTGLRGWKKSGFETVAIA